MLLPESYVSHRVALLCTSLLSSKVIKQTNYLQASKLNQLCVC